MKKDNDWNEIKSAIEDKDLEIIEKYGFDIRKKFTDSLKKENILKRKRRIFLFKFTCILITVILIFIICHNINSDVMNQKILQDLNSFEFSQVDFEFVSSDTNFFGKGFFVYKINDIGDNEMHVFKNGDIYAYDLIDRYCKYFFEQWEDKDKHLFKIEETYSDYTLGLKTKKDWLLHYNTYIYASTEEEVIYATEAIIRFVEFMNKPNILANCHIMVGNTKITPNCYSGQTPEKIREMALTFYYDSLNT